MNQEQLRNLDTIVNTYGNDPQTDMAIEECSELIKALLKYRRKRYSEDAAGAAVEKELRAAIIDEIADVQIMIAQLQIMHDCIGEVEEKIDFKIKRQIERINRRCGNGADRER